MFSSILTHIPGYNRITCIGNLSLLVERAVQAAPPPRPESVVGGGEPCVSTRALSPLPRLPPAHARDPGWTVDRVG